MKIILLILLCSICAFGQTDACKETSNIERVPIKPGGSIKTINDVIQNPEYKSKVLFIEVQAGNYEGEKGILIDRDKVCLVGVGKPIIKRTKFKIVTGYDEDKNPVYEYEPSIIKISGASKVSVKGFNLTQGKINLDNRGVDATGISVMNFDKTEGISNIYIEDNFIHSIGQFYEYEKPDGYWRYKKPDKFSGTYEEKTECKSASKTKISEIKVSCGQAHGINVASNQNPISHIFIRGNTLSNLRLGESEAITVGERISDFDVSGNTIHDVDNIAIDIAGRQSGTYQSTNGTVRNNTIYNLKGAKDVGGQNKGLGGQNDAYPFVAGIYIDGGTGLSWDKSIKVTNNSVTDFGIGISVGSENNYCDFCNSCKKEPDKNDACKEFCNLDKCKSKVCCSKVKVEYILLMDNTLTRNQVYGIGIGKNDKDQNSQTWNVRVFGNTVVDNVLSKDDSGYSQIHFGSLEEDSLQSIEVRNNVIKSFGKDNGLLVRVAGSFLRPNVKFYENVFYSGKNEIWDWDGSVYCRDKTSDKCKDKLVNSDNTLKLPSGIVGDKNIWADK